MAANIGRLLVLKTGTTAIAGIRTKGIAFNGEPVDITTDDSSGYRELLSTAGNMSIDISFDGITKDNELRTAALANADLELASVSIDYPNGDTLTFNKVLLTGLEETGAYQDALTYSGTLQSSGQWTYTPA